MTHGYDATALADQDILNAVIAAQPKLLYALPCQWNVQLGDSANSEHCYTSVQELKIIHWNSPDKVASHRHRHIRYFRALYYTFLQYDGNLLRRELLSCQSKDAKDPELPMETGVGPDDECYEMRAEEHLVRRTHLYYLDYVMPSSSDPTEVTLVSQLSLDRLQLLESLAKHWTGPMSLAVYLSDDEARQLVQFVRASAVLRSRRDIGYHLVYKQGQFYPVNHLRNIAIQQAHSGYIFLLDFDFLPSADLHNYLRAEIARISSASDSSAEQPASKTAFVVPAFETFQYRLRFPGNKAELLEQLNLGHISPFRQDVWPAAHKATDYGQWKSATRSYDVGWQSEYEPYVVLPKSTLLFDPRFVGFGWNKVAFIMELDILGYTFRVLPNAFIIHLPHASSLDLTRFRSSHLYRKCIYRLKVEYIKYLAKKHGVRALKYLSFRSDTL